MRMHIRAEIQHEVETLVDAYLRYHLEDALPSRTVRVIAQLRDLRKP